MSTGTQVAIKPAKPLCFGMLQGTPVFGLPGNPVSSLVSFELFARPALRMMMGHDRPFRREVLATAASAAAAPASTASSTSTASWWTWSTVPTSRRGVRSQASNVLSAMAAANGLALLPDGDGVDAGDPVTVMLLD